jgi:hypothetical protein
MITATINNDQVKVYASYDTLTLNLNLFLLNKETTSKKVSLSLTNYSQQYTGSRHLFSGNSVNDKFPKFNRADTIIAGSDKTELTLPAVSVTVLKLMPGRARLTSFTGALAENQVNLNWQAENDFIWPRYTVERSISTNQAFDSIGVLNIKSDSFGAGYTFSDSNGVANKTVYYRLKMVSPNGAVWYSDTLSFVVTAIVPDSESPTTFLFSIAPNPVGNSLQLKTYARMAQPATLQIVDATGRVWDSEKVRIEAGTATITLRNLHGLQCGVYWLQVQIGSTRQTLPFLKR